MSFAPTKADRGDIRVASGRALAGFLLSGFLLAFLGAILPAWGYHRDPPDFVAVGNYFLSVALGLGLGVPAAWRILGRRGLRFLLVFACLLACAALLYLAFVPPPLVWWWRAGGLLILGASAGLLNVALFQALSQGYSADAAGTIIQGGIWYGLGCLAATLLVEGAFYLAVSSILVLMAAAPAVFAVLYSRTSFGPSPPKPQPPVRQVVGDFRSLGAILFALLLFFQFGNEWSLAGWLPLFLCRRVGMSPQQALFTLGLYWFFLMAGRFGAVAALPRVRHGRLLLASVMAALFGLLVLYYTNNAFGAVAGVFFLGAGFASVYPLVAEAIGRRFHYYHPGFCNGIFSLAMLGGLIAPATLGYSAAAVGDVGIVVGIPLLGTFVVVALLLLIWLESKVTGR